MNERIKELKHQASLWCDKNIPEQYSEETNGYGRAWEDKFAELLVQECAYIVENSPWQLRRGYKAIDQANLVKQHFGVEL
jgi:hypothetical protein